MVTTLGAWDELGSSIVGAVIAGVLGGITVLIGVRLSSKQDEKRYARAEADRGRVERRSAGDSLLLAVHTLRDAVAVIKVGESGKFNLYPLRERLMLAKPSLGEYPSYAIVQEFYDAADSYRSWRRANPPLVDDVATEQVVRQFREPPGTPVAS
jgi:hypothetical protein